jgi:Plant transposon protein
MTTSLTIKRFVEMAVLVRGIRRRSLKGGSECHEKSSTKYLLSYLRTYFRERNDVTGKPGAFPIRRVVSALRQLCYGLSSDGVEEYKGLSESTSNKALKMFCNVLIQYLGEMYLRRPTAADLKHIESVYRSKGFPGCIGCLDCAGWTWDLGPVAHSGRNRPLKAKRD